MQDASYEGRQETRTRVPGVWKRGNRYVVRYRDAQGRSHKRHARTLAEARQLKATLNAAAARGELRDVSRVTLADYARDWISTYDGRTGRGVRPATRADYRSNLERNAIPFFGAMRLAEIEPRDIRAFAKHVGDKGASPNTVRLALAPVKALLATAVEDGLLRSNPTTSVRIASARPATPDEEERARALTEDELRRLLDEVPEGWRLLVELLAHTGLRIGEALALHWGDIDLGQRRLRVRRRLYRGSIAAPKSAYGRREVPLSPGVAQSLWQARKAAAAGQDGDPVFASQTGGYLDPGNLFGRVLKPSARRAGVPWAGFHTLRHTCATMLFRHGLNAAQVRLWLGHHSPTFTVSTYVHLLPGDLPQPTFLDELTRRRGDTNGDTRAASAGLDPEAV